MRYLKALALVVLFFFSMLFFTQNVAVLTQELVLGLKVFRWEYHTAAAPFYLLILLAFVVGAVSCILYFFMERVRLTRECRRLRRDKDALEREVASLRPVTSPSYVSEDYPGHSGN